MSRAGVDMLGIPATGLAVLRDVVHERTGLFYDDGRIDLLAERLAPVVLARGFRSFLDLYYLLKYEEDAGQAWAQVFDALSVPETYFWREIDQVRAVVCRIVPELLRQRRGPLRIWSVPCAGGEEPLSIAMALNEAGWFDRAAIEIHGSDASPAGIARAQAGRYRARAMRALPPTLVEKYFDESTGTWTPKPELSRRITSWSVVNLLDQAQVAPLAASPVIFCRNAFIYFSPSAVARVVASFAASMPSPAYLCVGVAESLLNVTTDFVLEEMDGAFVYVKRGLDV